MEETEPQDDTPTPPARRKKRWVLWSLVGVFYVVLLGSHLIPQDLRIESAGYARIAWGASLVLVLQGHLGLCLLVVCGATAWDRRWRVLGALLPLLALCLLPEAWAVLPRTPPATQGESLTVLTCNMYWIAKDTGPLTREISDADADLVLLQEYSPHWHDAIGSALGARYPHRVTAPRDNAFGLAVYSKRPLVPGSTKWLPTGRVEVPQLRFELELAGRRIAVYNVHVVPPSSNWYHEHRHALADVLEAAAGERLPTLLVGDFNFTPRSPFHDAATELGFADAFAQAGSGRGSTCDPHFVPLMLRVDYVFMRGLAASECRPGVGEGSDHRPVIARVGFPE